MNKMYSFEEIGLIPKTLSCVDSRTNVNPYTEEGDLPIFVSPMTCILSPENIEKFEQSKAIPILPVTPDTDSRYEYKGWKALSIAETAYLINNDKISPVDRILVDCANGHMTKLFSLIRVLKEKYPTVTVMVGNIANPETYIECCKYGVDYVRVGIGGGSGCTTSVLTGFHASLPWLLAEIEKFRKGVEIYPNGSIIHPEEGSLQVVTKVVADGGVNSISRAIKSIALGADYVMMGRCFASSEEACGDCKVSGTGEKVRRYYGQSSIAGQIDRFGRAKANPEGCDFYVPVSYTVHEFLKKFEDCLRSAMSYAGAFDLQEFRGKVQYEIMSKAEYDSYIK